MTKRTLRPCAVLLPALSAVLMVSLSGCSLPGTLNSSAASSPTPRPAAATSRPLASATGAWTFRDAYTVENLRLHQAGGGVVGGDGDSAVKNKQGGIDHSAINIHRGYLSKGKLTLTLYVMPVDWGSGETVAEYLTCAAVTPALHCRTDIPLFRVHNVRQDFYRRA